MDLSQLLQVIKADSLSSFQELLESSDNRDVNKLMYPVVTNYNPEYYVLDPEADTRLAITHLCCFYGAINILQYCIRSLGGDMQVKAGRDKYYPLHYAAAGLRKDLIASYLDSTNIEEPREREMIKRFRKAQPSMYVSASSGLAFKSNIININQDETINSYLEVVAVLEQRGFKDLPVVSSGYEVYTNLVTVPAGIPNYAKLFKYFWNTYAYRTTPASNLLTWCIRHNDLQSFEDLFESYIKSEVNPFEVYTPERAGKTIALEDESLLNLACVLKKIKFVKKILKYAKRLKSPVDMPTPYKSALFSAIRSEDTKIFDLVLATGVNLYPLERAADITSLRGSTGNYIYYDSLSSVLINTASIKFVMHVVEALTKLRYDWNARFEVGYTYLYLLCTADIEQMKAVLTVVALLVRSGADVNTEERSGTSVWLELQKGTAGKLNRPLVPALRELFSKLNVEGLPEPVKHALIKLP